MERSKIFWKPVGILPWASKLGRGRRKDLVKTWPGKCFWSPSSVECGTDLADVRTVDNQIGVRKLTLTLGKRPHFPQGWGRWERDQTRSSWVQGDGHQFQFTEQPRPAREQAAASWGQRAQGQCLSWGASPVLIHISCGAFWMDFLRRSSHREGSWLCPHQSGLKPGTSHT